MLRLGLSTCFFTDGGTAAEWKTAKEAGFSDAEISLRGPLEDYIRRGTALSAVIREAGIRVYSIHVPFSSDFDLTCPDPAQWQAIEDRYKACIDAGKAWGAENVTTHASTEPIDQAYRKERLERGKYLYKVLGDYAAERGMRITVEDLPRLCMGNCSEDCLAMTDGEVSFITFDVNHLLKETHEHFVRAAGSRIVMTHLSDYDFIDERHWVPGDGKINWKELYTLLTQADYRGPYLFELSETVSGTKITPQALADRFYSLIGVGGDGSDV